MSVSGGSVVVAIKAVDDASSVFEKIQTNVGLLGGVFQQLGGPLAGVGSVMEGFAAGGPAGAGMAALGQVAGFLQGAVKDAAESERIFTALGKAIENQGGNWESLKPHIEGVLTSMTSTSKFSDEQLAASLRSLVTAGMPVEKALKTLSTAMDTAVGSGQPLDTVSTAIAKAFGGQDSALTRLVPGMADLVKQLGPGATDGDKFAAVMGGLNQKFGGQAAADAATYAGTQERLKNAMGELGEKVGTILTPALEGFAQAMIPAVDQLAQGVQGIQSWLTEVGKMPEVKGTLDAIGKAWGGFQDWAGKVGKALTETLGPAFSDLWDALKPLGEALAPLGEALGEIFKAMTGGKEGGNALKDVLDGVAAVIKLIAQGIRDVTPVIKAIAEGFKTAADLIAPPLASMREAIGGFIDWLREVFGGFYTWLVGGSLWPDLWTGLGSIATTAITGLLTNIGTSLFGPLKTGFQTTVESLKTIFGGVTEAITKPLDAVSTAISGKFPEMSKAIAAGSEILKGDWASGLKKLADATPGAFTEVVSAISKSIGDMGGQISKNMTDALTAAHDAFNKWVDSLGGTDLFKGLLNAAGQAAQAVGQTGSALQSAGATVTTAATAIGTTLTTNAQNWLQPFTQFYNSLVGQSIWPDTWNEVQAVSLGTLQVIENAFMEFQTIGVNVFLKLQTTITTFWITMTPLIMTSLQTMREMWRVTVTDMANITQIMFDRMAATIAADIDRMIKTLEDAKKKVSSGSIWPNMLSEMVQQSEAAMANMNAAFASGLTGPRGVVTMMGNASIPAPQAQAGPTYLSAEVPIRNEISIDGEQISTIINRNTIRQRQLQRAAFA